MAAMWIFVALLALGVVGGAWALMRAVDGGRAQSILSERLARGDLSPEEYRQRLALIGGRSSSRILLVPVALGLVVLGLVGAVAAGGIAMGRGEMGWMMGDRMGDLEGMMMGGESGRRGDPPKQGVAGRNVEGTDFSFTPSTIRIPANESVNISFRNTGASYHTFTVRGLDFELRAQAGEDISGSLRVTSPGRYSAVCTVPGHERMGMTATVVVER